MPLEGILEELWNRTDAISRHNADFEAVRDNISAASEAVRNHYANRRVRHPGIIEGVEGVAIIDRVEEFSEIYLGAAGKTETNRPLYAHHMRRILGNNYEEFKNALKIGDIDSALVLSRNALVGDNYVAEVTSIIERVELLPQEQKTEWATHAAQQIGGNNPLAVLENLPRYFQTLKQIKALAQPYITTAPAPGP